MKTEYYRMAPCPTIYPIRLERLLMKLNVINLNCYGQRGTWVQFVIRMYGYQYGKTYSYNGDHFEEE